MYSLFLETHLTHSFMNLFHSPEPGSGCWGWWWWCRWCCYLQVWTLQWNRLHQPSTTSRVQVNVHAVADSADAAGGSPGFYCNRMKSAGAVEDNCVSSDLNIPLPAETLRWIQPLYACVLVCTVRCLSVGLQTTTRACEWLTWQLSSFS